MIVADSNIWIALLDASDSQHEKAVRLVSTFEEDLLVPEYVILEVCTILKQKRRKQLASNFVQKILMDPDIHVAASESTHLARVIDVFCKHEHKHLSFVDVSLFLLAKSHTVYTFDKKLASAIKKYDRA
ncbi:type II toxin-antitoxin system VapC family toxin [Candidatus Uhrbacteria bacterium]|nr:type II toxin-antitoxin system VapC family toxin [Candidatus Uhrbacteria bacterium]